ncbi:sulfotransferase family 2 domain-containing protein [Puniceibacterium confluentis]|uniref:sulfotransferase family 2 domain-containing protein n=1 Tax=Puniceibacterium confluentis TaxID=1958944 RepID=UPI0011B6C17A|nr:sulfotransferase family 2 domain-containing protein [Puniceibacterium confluentis]
MGWRGYIDPSRKTVFFWSQKAACTTLFNLLADNMAERPTSKKHFHTESDAYPGCLRALEQGYRSVILVRAPATRTISAYFNKFCVYNGKSLKTRDDLEPFAQELFDLFRARTGQESCDNLMSFEDYLDTVAALHAARPEPGAPVNGHWDTQIPAFLAANPGFRYDHVVHVENFDAEMQALAEPLNLRINPRQMNRTPVADSNRHRGYLGRVPARDVASYAFGYRNFQNFATMSQIEAIYGVDYDSFGYARDAGRYRTLRDRMRQLARRLRNRLRKR